MTKLPIPPFTLETAIVKVRMAENAWNTKNPNVVKMAYSESTIWRNRSEFLYGRDQVETFLQGKWNKEQEYRLIKEVWAHSEDRIAVRFCYEYYNAIDSQWYRAYGNENWLFDPDGYMKERHASINDVPITETERKFRWSTPTNIRPDDHPGLSELGL